MAMSSLRRYGIFLGKGYAAGLGGRRVWLPGSAGLNQGQRWVG